MIIKKRTQGNVFIFDISGNFLRTDPNFGELRQQVTNLIREGHRNFLINMVSLVKMDSSGLGEIVASLALVRRAGGQLGYFPYRDIFEKFGLELTQSSEKWGFDNEGEAIRKLFR